MNVITVGSSKGGVGKSTLATNIAAQLAALKHSVLLIDTDPQQTAYSWDCVRETKLGDANRITTLTITSPILHKEIKKHNFDFTVIDAGGRYEKKSPGEKTTSQMVQTFKSAILAADIVIAVTQPSPADTWAVNDVLEMIEECKMFISDEREIPAYIVVTRANPKGIVDRETLEALQEFGGQARTLRTLIRENVLYKKCTGLGLGVVEMDNFPVGIKKDPKPAADIISLVDELLEKLKLNN